MIERRWLQLGAVGRAAVGMAVATASLGRVNGDARIAVGVASIALPLCSLGAATALDDGRDRVAAALLLLSAATPNYFAWMVNVPALLVRAALLVGPARTVGVIAAWEGDVEP